MRRKEKSIRHRKRLSLMSYKELKTTITGYGYEYSFATFMKSVFVAFAGMIAAGYLYKLEIPYILACLLAAIVTLPFIIRSQFRYLNEQKRFSDITSYMEQLIYNFQKRPKILQAVTNVGDLFEGDIKHLCRAAQEYIQKGVYQVDLYREAFLQIEKEYHCERLVSLHKFLGEVEMQGGEYQTALNILLDDLKLWVSRTYEFQKERKKVKNYITVAVGLALFICYATTKMMPPEFSITGNPIYQLSTTITIILLIIMYAAVQTKINGAWLHNDVEEQSKIKKDYDLAVNGNVKVLRKKMLPFFIVMVCLAIYSAYLQKSPLLASAIGVMFWLYHQPSAKVKYAKKRITREIKKQFPLWLRNLTLHLQRENVQVAIVNSIPSSPYILRKSLKQLQVELNNDPVSIRPYSLFMKDFDLPELKSAMQMLYSFNNVNKKDTISQINAMVERNSKLLEQSERIKEEDAVSIMGFIVALPMILSFIKLITDIILIIFNFLAKMGI